MTMPEEMPEFPHSDERGEYRAVTPLLADATLHASPRYEWRGMNPEHGWRASRDNLQELADQDRIHWTASGRPYRKQYRNEYAGVPISADWSDIPIASGKERTGYRTQKPLPLLRRIIEASSNEGDMVLDPFCGCATACVAAEQLERQWAGIDVSPKAAELVRSRLQREVGMFWQGAHREDMPQRTDLGPIPAYNSQENRERLYGRQGGYCNGCQTHFTPRNLAVDHIVPQSKGGGHHIDNLQLLCPACNSAKGSGSHAQLIARLTEQGIR